MPTFTHPKSTPNCTPPNSDCPHPQEVSQLPGTTPASQFLDQNLAPGHTSPATATQSENLCCPVFTRIQIQPPLPTATTLALATDVLLTAVDSRCPCFPHSVLSAQWLRQLQSGRQIVSLLCCKLAYPRPNPCTYTTLPSTACFLTDGTVTVPPRWAAVALGCCSRPGLLLSALCLDTVRFAPSNYIRGFPDRPPLPSLKPLPCS